MVGVAEGGVGEGGVEAVHVGGLRQHHHAAPYPGV